VGFSPPFPRRPNTARKKVSMFFFEKKEPKNFYLFRPIDKSFLLLFFQKRSPSFFWATGHNDAIP
jgi:hypothetical protein